MPLPVAALALVSLPANAFTADHPAGDGARNRHPSAQAVRQSTPQPVAAPPDGKRPLVPAKGFVPAAAGYGVKNSYIVALKQELADRPHDFVRGVFAAVARRRSRPA
ncbi:hypothetical protein [Nonomuraea sp. NPDC049625]|uniref:hypothetical protein n=1 Tax=Nonomuraea sp. NPDC049625 TaxID=3155775 RepID=UPI003444C35A